MTTYTSGLRLTNQDTGANANTWGDICDDNFEFIDDAITGMVSIDITGASSHTLTNNNGSDDEARNMSLYIHGIPTSANSVIVPASEKMYIVRSSYTSITGNITVRTAGGTGVEFTATDSAVVYCDGTSVHEIGGVSALDPSDNLSDLEDASAARDNLGLQPEGTYLYTSGTQIEANISAFTSVIFEVIWPVGSLYSNRTDGTNPGTLMGFGTWASAGVGRVPIGVGTGVDADGVSAIVTAESCGGSYQATLSAGHHAAHTHSINKVQGVAGTAGPGTNNVVFGPSSGTDFTTSGSGSTGSQGDGDAFNIQNPWYSVYMWVRTA